MTWPVSIFPIGQWDQFLDLEKEYEDAMSNFDNPELVQFPRPNFTLLQPGDHLNLENLTPMKTVDKLDVDRTIVVRTQRLKMRSPKFQDVMLFWPFSRFSLLRHLA